MATTWPDATFHFPVEFDDPADAVQSMTTLLCKHMHETLNSDPDGHTGAIGYLKIDAPRSGPPEAHRVILLVSTPRTEPMSHVEPYVRGTIFTEGDEPDVTVVAFKYGYFTSVLGECPKLGIAVAGLVAGSGDVHLMPVEIVVPEHQA